MDERYLSLAALQQEIDDKYPSLAALKQKEAGHWRVRCLDRQSTVTIIAPHGGFIEPGTSAIARAVAGRQYNLFDFQGLRRLRPHRLHVTATHFRDPLLDILLARSQTALAIHSMGPQHTKAIWLGGLNKQFKDIVEKHLLASGFEIDSNSPLYRGESPHNVVNLAAKQGVQLELSWELLRDLFHGHRFKRCSQALATTDRYTDLVNALRDALVEYLSAAR